MLPSDFFLDRPLPSRRGEEGEKKNRREKKKSLKRSNEEREAGIVEEEEEEVEDRFDRSKYRERRGGEKRERERMHRIAG